MGRELKGWQQYFEFMREEKKDGQTHMPVDLDHEIAKFEREESYIVLKKADLQNFDLSHRLLKNLEEVCDTVNYFRGLKGPVKCVVVEKDWPEYEVVWKLIEDRVNGNSRGTT